MTVTSAPTPVTAGTVLSLRGVSKRFGAVQALKNIDLDVRAGEVLALGGDNGAGKSTLAKQIAGVYTSDNAPMAFAGPEGKGASPAEVSEPGIAPVFQDLALREHLDVV